MRIKLFICLFLVPVVVYAVSFSMESVFNQRLREPIQRMHPDATARDLAAVSVKTLCARNIPQLRVVCGIYGHLRQIRMGAVAAVFCGLIALGLVPAARKAASEARKNIAALLEVFGIFLAGAYGAAHFALAAGCFYCVSMVFFGGLDKTFLAVSVVLSAALALLMTYYVNTRINAAAVALQAD